MKAKCTSVAFFVVSFLAFFTFAWSEEIPKVWTLAEAVKWALKESRLTAYARFGVEGAEAQKKGAFSHFLPQLSTYYQYTYLHPEPWSYMPPVSLSSNTPPLVLTSPGGAITVGTQNNYSWAIEAKQPIFAGGAIKANYEARKKGLDIARLDEQSTIVNLAADVKGAYFQVLKAEKMVELAQVALEQIKSHHRDAESFFAVGLIPKNDLLEAEVRLAVAMQHLIQAENALEVARSQFNTLLRRPINAPVRLKDRLEFQPFEKSMEHCMRKALENRPELRAYRLRVEQARDMVKVAKGELFPSLSLIGHYERYGDEADLRGTTFRSMENWYVAARVDWAFWEWGRTKYEVDARRAQENQILNLWEAERDRVILEVKTAFLKVKEAEKQVWVAKKAIEQAEENFRLNRERYREQLATSTDVLDAQGLLTKTKSDYVAALSDYFIYQAQLERAIGEMSP